MNRWYERSSFAEDMEQIVAIEMARGASFRDAENKARREEYRLYGNRRLVFTNQSWAIEERVECRVYMLPFEAACRREEKSLVREMLMAILMTPTARLKEITPHSGPRISEFKNRIREALGLPAEVGRRLPTQRP